MSEESFEQKWNQVKDDVNGWFDKTFGDAKAEIQGNNEKMKAWLQEKKGLAEEKAEEESKKFHEAWDSLQAKWEASRSDAKAKWSETEEEVSAKLKEFMSSFT